MMNDDVDFQRANDLLALLKFWNDGDKEEGIIRPLSASSANGKKGGMSDRYFRRKCIAQEHENRVVKRAMIMEKLIFIMVA